MSTRKLLEADQEQRDLLTTEEASIQSDFDHDSDSLDRIDSRVTATREQLARATDAAERAKLSETLARQQRAWTEARNRFDLLIARRKAVHEQLGVLTEKIGLERQILDQMTSLPPIAGAAGATGATATGPSGATGSTSAPVAPAPARPPPLSTFLGIPLPSPASNPSTAQNPDALLDAQILQAQKDLNSRETALTAAEQSVKLLDRGIDIFERDLSSSHDLLETAKKQADAAEQSLQRLDARIAERKAAGASGDDLKRVQTRRDDVQKDLDAARAAVVRQSKRIANSETALEHLGVIREKSVSKVQDAQSDVQSAQRRVAFLESPFAPHQLTRWFITKGPRVLGVILGMLVFWWLAHLIGGRVVETLLHKARRDNTPEHSSRAETLRRVFESTAGVAIITLGILTALNQAGIDVTVLLGGAAVLGAAIAFGSQNLIKDYFSGFMILIENQYSVGNVVRIGDTTGTVEDITLRMTSIRDLEGILHFIPHNQITSVSNLTYGWSRIVLDIRVASSDDVDRAMAAIMETARDLKADAVFGPQIVDDPHMLGVDAISAAAVTIKLLIKTRPLNRWPVKREFLRRLKKRLDAAGIRLA